jgi:hypothetical protein
VTRRSRREIERELADLQGPDHATRLVAGRERDGQLYDYDGEPLTPREEDLVITVPQEAAQY